jgi:Vitamin K-dependent gamma-carboxylase
MQKQITALKKYLTPLDEYLSVDTRALALVRIGLGVCLLYDLIVRSLTIASDYGDHSMLPSYYAQTFWNGGYAWSLHLINGGTLPILYSLFTLHIVLAVLLIIGYRTRVVLLLAWILLLSLHNANQFFWQGGDGLLRITMFVCLFLPLSARWSIDALRNTLPPRLTVRSAWGVAFLVQVACFYFFAAQLKTGFEWAEGSAIYYTLSSYYYTKLLGFALMQFPWCMYILTYGVVYLQEITPFLCFSPVLTRYTRAIAFTLLFAMHSGLGLAMRVGFFSCVSIVALLVYTPTSALDYIEKILTGKILTLKKSAAIAETYLKKSVRSIIELLGVSYIVFLFCWQAGSSPLYMPYNIHTPYVLDPLVKTIRIDQYWNIFTQSLPWRGWHIMAAELSDGRIVDLLRDAAPVSFERPDSVPDLYYNARWKRWITELIDDQHTIYRQPVIDYWCKQWNTDPAHAQKIVSITLIYMGEHVPLHGEPAEKSEPYILINSECVE